MTGIAKTGGRGAAGVPHPVRWMAVGGGITALVTIVIAIGVAGGLPVWGGSAGGGEVHASLVNGSVAEAKTSSGERVRVTVTNLVWSQQGEGAPKAPVVTVRIDGGEPRSLDANAWTLVLEDGTVLALKRLEEQQTETYRFWLEGSLPVTTEVRSVRFRPENLPGGVFFDLPPGAGR